MIIGMHFNILLDLSKFQVYFTKLLVSTTGATSISLGKVGFLRNKKNIDPKSVKPVSKIKKVLISIWTTTNAPSKLPVIFEVIRNDQKILEKSPLLLSVAHWDKYLPCATHNRLAPNPQRAEASSYKTIMKLYMFWSVSLSFNSERFKGKINAPR